MTKITMQEVIDGWESPVNRKQVKATYDEYYNQAIDAALIEVYEKKRIYSSIYRADKSLAKMELLCDELISKLEALKKKP